MSSSELGGGGLGFRKLEYRNEDPAEAEGGDPQVSYTAEGAGQAEGGPVAVPAGAQMEIPPNGHAMDVTRVVIQIAGGAAAGAYTYQATGAITDLNVTAGGPNGVQAQGSANGQPVPGHIGQ